MALNHKRSAAVVAQRRADRAERLAVRGLQADLQAVLDGINSNTTLAQLRGYVQDVARVCRRVLRLPNVAG
jgi:hypothetical protein